MSLASEPLKRYLRPLSARNQEINDLLAGLLDRAFHQPNVRSRKDWRELQKTVNLFVWAELTLDCFPEATARGDQEHGSHDWRR